MRKQSIFAMKGHLVYSQNQTTLSTHPDSWLVCENGKIAGIFRELPEQYAHIPTQDYGDRLIVPGLTDLHMHAPQYAFRGLGMDLELLDWLNEQTFPQESKYADAAYADTAYGLFTADLAKSATTRACIFATLHSAATLRLMELLERTGIRAYVGKVNMDRNSPDCLREHNAAQSLGDTKAWLEDCGFHRITPILTPRFVPSCTDALMAGLSALQKSTGLPVQSHLSENLSEVAWVKELCPDAASYADAYHRLGLFGGDDCPTIMAHCVYCDESELALMKRQNIFIAHCPQSNVNLSSGIAPARAWLEQGQRVGLGSDMAGGYSLSIFRAMADAVQMSKLRWRLVDDSKKPLTVPEAFYLATVGGGSFFGQVGAFLPGWDMDALVLDDHALVSPSPLTPEQRLERVIYCGGDNIVLEKYCMGDRIFSAGAVG